MGLYKLCNHKGRGRDRCDHPWWGSYRGIRVSLPKWTNRKIDSKEEAGAALDDLRQAIREGTFNRRGLGQTEPAEPLTFRKFSDTYAERYVKAKRLKTADTIDWRLKPLRSHFGDRLLSEIKTADIEDYIADLKKPRTVNRQKDRRLAPASINRQIALLRHMFNWAVGREYLDRTPFRRGSEPLIRLEREDNKRRCRLTPEQETKLLEVAADYLRPMIIAALDTGMRKGEMLALTFGDIDQARQLIVLRGGTTKSGKTRLVPIGTVRLKSVLDFQRIDADGKEKPATSCVFSNPAGEPILYFRKAWLAALKAAGISGLRWHDLRHEYASRLVERGVPLAQVRDLLGHASIVTTERYDTQTLESLQAAAKKLEDGKSFNISSSSGDQTPPSDEDPAVEADRNPLTDEDLQTGGPPGDRTQDTVIKSGSK